MCSPFVRYRMKETAIGRERMKKREKFTRQRGSDQGRVWGVRHRTRETYNA